MDMSRTRSVFEMNPKLRVILYALFPFRLEPRVFIGQGRFFEARAQFLFFKVSSDKLRARVASLNLRGLKGCNIFNGTTMVGAIGKILKIMIARLFQITILEL